MNSRNIVIGALAGFAIGTLAGALYDSSTSAGTLNVKKVKAYSKGLKKAVNKFIANSKDTVEAAKEDAADLLKKGKAEMHKAKQNLETALS